MVDLTVVAAGVLDTHTHDTQGQGMVRHKDDRL